MTAELERTPLELEIPTDADNRLLIRTWQAATGTVYVTVAPERRGGDGVWHLRHSGLALEPDVARELGPMLATMADVIDGTA